MTSAWFLWYGLKVGLTRQEALNEPFGGLLDLIAIHQIKVEGAKRKKTAEDQEREFLALLSYK